MKLQNIKRGDILCLISYVKVDSKSSFGEKIEVSDLEVDQQYTVSGKELIERLYTADSFDSEEKVTKTKLAEIFVTKTGNLPFTVVFEKKDGSERTLRGKLVSSEGFLGYSMVVDLDKKAVRQVNHNTLKSLIVGGKRYVLK